MSEHSSQVVFGGALMAFFTSVRLKYICAPSGRYFTDEGNPRTSQRVGQVVVIW